MIREKEVDVLCRKHGAELMNFEDLAADQWVHMDLKGSHWLNGITLAKPVLDADAVVITCCLKTHGYGAVFTMSLKLAVGMVHKRNMAELHSSFRSMRKMIAEINQVYSPALVLLDGIEAFTDQGPMTGTRKRAEVLIAGTDRVAVDAVGLAILKKLGSNKAIMSRKIFEQEQIARAVELGLGVSDPGDIEIVTDSRESALYAENLGEILRQG